MSCNEPTSTHLLKHLNSSFASQPNSSSLCEPHCEEKNQSDFYDHVSKGVSKENFMVKKTDVVSTLPPKIQKHVNQSSSRTPSSYDQSSNEFCEKANCKDTELTYSAKNFNTVQKPSEYFKKMTIHVIQCYGSKNWCLLRFRNSKKKTYILIASILCLFLVVLLIASCLILLCLSPIIQNYLNTTTIQVLSSVLTRPEESQFDILFTTRIQRQTSLPFLLHTFPANVFYLPKNNISSNSSVRSLRESVSSSNRPLSKPLAKTMIPEMFLNHKIQNIQPTTTSTIYIEDSSLFASFLKELMQTGSAQWILQGYPSGRFFFFHYKNLYFEKQLDIHGPSFISTTNKNFSQNGIGSVSTMALPKNCLKIISIDLTESTKEQAYLYVDILLINDQSTLTINPLGILYFNVFYKEQLLCFLTTNHSVILQPGETILSFYGRIEPISSVVNKKRYIILNEFFSFLLHGEAVSLQAVGVNSSIELFSPAIQSINISNKLSLLESQPTETTLDVNDFKSKQSLIQSIETLGLKFKEETDVMYPLIPVVGTFRIVVANPFGPNNNNIIVKQLNLKGSLIWLKSLNDVHPWNVSLPSLKTAFIETSTTLNRSLKICSIQGYQSYPNISPQSLVKSYKKLGAMSTDIQELFVTIEMLLNISETEYQFISFVRYLFEHAQTTLQFLNVSVGLVMTTPIGETNLEKLPLNTSFHIKGFSKMEGLNVNAMSIKLSQPNTTSLESLVSRLKSPLVNISVSLPATEQLSLFLGTLALSVTYHEDHLVDLLAENCRLEPNTTSFVTFRGTVSKNTTTLDGLFGLYLKIQAKKLIELKGTFIPVTNINSQMVDTSPFWIRQALLGMTINITINRNQSHDMVEKPPHLRIRDVIASGFNRFFANQNTPELTPTTDSFKDTSTSTINSPVIRHIRPGTLLANFFENLQH